MNDTKISLGINDMVSVTVIKCTGSSSNTGLQVRGEVIGVLNIPVIVALLYSGRVI